MNNLKNYRLIFFIIFIIFFILLFIKIMFFNIFDSDDGFFADVSLNILKRKLAVNFYGNFLEHTKYALSYPPLHALFTAIAFKIFGVSYLSSKFVSILFALLLAIIVSIYSYRKLNIPLGLIVTALVLFDPLLFGFTYNNRPEMIATFFFTMAALIFTEALKRDSLKLIFISGLFSGLAMFSSYNCNWLFIAFTGYMLYQIFCEGFKDTFNKIVTYLFAAFIVIGPWFLWILLNPGRRSIFFLQIIGSTASIDGYSLTQVSRRLFNPLADLYLAVFRYHSPYPIIACLIFFYFLFNFKKKIYPFLLLISSLIMMFFNFRAAHYFIISLPIFYIYFGYLIEDLLYKKKFKWPILKSVYILLILVIFTGLFDDLCLVFKKPDLKLDSQYYSRLLKEYTKDNTRIATDPVFVLSEHGNRKIINIGLLIWEVIRKSYKNYDEVVSKIVDADYIILTERKKKWGEAPLNQSIEFQKYLKERCTLLEIVDDKVRGPIWIYKSNHRNNLI